MRRRRFLAALGVGLAGCTGRPSSPTDSPTSTLTDSSTSAPTPTEDERPTATTRDPDTLSVSGSWPQFGADAGHSGVTSNAGVPEGGEAYWHLPRIRSGPVVLADGQLFHFAELGTDESAQPTITRTREQPAGTAHDVDGEPHLLARDASEGRIEWAIPIRGYAAGWPAVAHGRVVVGLRSGLAAFDASDGRERWKRDLSGRNIDTPTIVGDTVVVPVQGTVDGQTGEVLEEPAVGAYALSDGSLRWSARLPKRSNAVAVAGASVIVASFGWDGTGVVLALSLADGTERWRTEIAGDYFHGPTLADGTIYVSSSTGVLQALSLADGTERWRRPFDHRPGGFAADGDSVYVGSRGALLTLDAADGSDRWSVEADSADNTFVAPAVGAETIYAGTVGIDAQLYAFDRSDGTERWSRWLPNTTVEGDMVTSGLEAQPIVAEGAVYAYAADGLYAFGPGN